MRETRLSGSEGGGARTRSPYPYLIISAPTAKRWRSCARAWLYHQIIVGTHH